MQHALARILSVGHSWFGLCEESLSGPPARSQGSPEPDDQVPLFPADPGRGRPAPEAPAKSRPIDWNPQAELRRLVGELTRATATGRGAVNAEINRRLGVRSHAGADLELVRRAVDVAGAWLEELAGLAEPAPALGTASPHGGAGAWPADRPKPAIRRPTAEQEVAVAVFRSGNHLALQAGAGTGKTTTLTMLARADRRQGRYIAFNRSIAADAAAKFPPNVACRTGHSLAYADIGRRFESRLRSPRKPAWRSAAELGISPKTELRIGDRTVTNKGLAYALVRTVRRFCFSADTTFQPYHVPRLRGLQEEDLHHQLAQFVLPYARKAWDDLQSPAGGVMRFEHDHYLKMWALTKPTIHGDYLLLDEAQDTNPVLEEVFNNQRAHAQLVMVGDSAQAIYSWRGARDVMTDFDGEQLALSQSFRFGPALAQEANRWLTLVESPIRLSGTPAITTTIGPAESPDAILCRTNVGAMLAVMQLLADNRRVALVGGGAALEELAIAAGQLKAGRRASHPELILFSTWGELQDYAEFDPSGQDLLPLVEIIDEHGVDVILAAVRKLSEERDAQIAVSTAHKAKGREWPCVQIAPDFEPAPSEETDAHGKPLPVPIQLEEARLAYVAVTRARQHLDPAGLAWLDTHPDAPARRPIRKPLRPALMDERSKPGGAGANSPWDLLGPPPADH